MAPFTSRPSSLAAVSARVVALILLSATVTGCDKYKLFSVGPGSAPTGWHQYLTPRAPETPVEEAVIRVAQTRKDSAAGELDIFFVVDDVTKQKPVQCVDVVGKGGDKDPHSGRSVTRYRIVDGMIAAMSDTSSEFYVDGDLERAVLHAVALTWSADPVVIYRKGATSMGLASHPIDKCNTDVVIYDGLAPGSAPIASKKMSFCFYR